jgi:hypothetical protein
MIVCRKRARRPALRALTRGDDSASEEACWLAWGELMGCSVRSVVAPDRVFFRDVAGGVASDLHFRSVWRPDGNPIPLRNFMIPRVVRRIGLRLRLAARQEAQRKPADQDGQEG